MAKMVRNNLIDTLRGVTIVSMVIYHAMWDLIYMFGQESGAYVHASWYAAWPGYLWQQSICWSFILLSGYCVRYSLNPAKRGLIVLACGAAVSVVTFVFMPEAQVQYGVLTFLGSAMILAGVLRVVRGKCVKWMNESEGTGTLTRFLKKMSQCTRPHDSFLFAVICAVLLFLTRNVNAHTFGFEELRFGHVPDALYQNLFTAYVGFPPKGFFSTDYFSLIPWVFLFGVGMGVGAWIGRGGDKGDGSECHLGKQVTFRTVPFVTSQKTSQCTRPLDSLCNCMRFLGRHSLIIYMLHQVVIYACLYLIFRL